MEAGFLQAIAAALSPQTAAALTTCNEKTARYGLVLSPSEAAALVETRTAALRQNGRIEFGSGILNRLVLTFCNSPYLIQSSYTETLHELVEIFYYFKNECMDLISDDELIEWMKHYFDTSCQGSLDLLRNRELEHMAYEIRHGSFDFNTARGKNDADDTEEEDEDG